jgi:N-sulfoglucosamine sulfohydrolase
METLNRRVLFQSSVGPALLGQGGTKRPPNIVFILSDDHSWPDLGVYGNSALQTPHLDRVGRSGMRFNRAFVTSPQCSPNRAALFTGCAAHTIAMSRLHSPLPPWELTYVDALREAGYFTGILRKHHMGESFQKRLSYYDSELRLGDFFSKRPPGRPFFLQVGSTDPHRPYTPGSYPVAHDPARVVVPPFLPDTPKVRADLANYYNAIARLDAQVGELLQLLERQGELDHTLILFTGDNGMPFPRAKGTLYEAGVNVPLLAWWPGHTKAGAVVDDLISHMDIAPTLIEVAGLKKSAKMQGRSLLPLLSGEPWSPREELFFERNWHGNLDLIRAVRTRRHKLIYNLLPMRNVGPIKDLRQSPTWESIVEEFDASRLPSRMQDFFALSRPVFELYDLSRDPQERFNLANDPQSAEVAEDLKCRLSNWMNETYDFLPPPYANYPASAGKENKYYDL